MGHKHSGNHGGVVFGGILIALGAVFLAGTIFGMDAGELLRTWWPVILIVLGVKGFFGNDKGTFWPLFVVLIGGLFLARNLGVLDHGLWSYIWPIGLVLLGLSMLFGPRRSCKKVHGSVGGVDTAETFNTTVVFSHQVRRIRAEAFRKGEGTAVFGNLELDFQECGIAPDSKLEVNAVFGSVKVMVPDGVHVALGGSSVLGGVSDKRASRTVPEGAPTLHLEANAVFGQVEILSS